MKDNLRREEILEVAEELFAEKGFEGVSMQEIAERVNIQKSALYYYFKSKKDIYNSLILGIYEKLEQSVREPVMKGAGQKEKISQLNPEKIITDCLSCRLQLHQATGLEVLHPVELLQAAVG